MFSIFLLALLPALAASQGCLERCFKQCTTNLRGSSSACVEEGLESDCAYMDTTKCKSKSAYFGYKSFTRAGTPCQNWNEQFPHPHTNTDVGKHNYCRNPDASSAPWCYTQDSSERWDYCFDNCGEETAPATTTTTQAPKGRGRGRLTQRPAPAPLPAPPTSNLPKWAQAVLDKHNELRSKVALGNEPGVPSAKYMTRMTWDEGIASEAQKYAESCVWGHDNNRGKGIGENIALNHAPDSYLEMVQLWYDEVKIGVPNYNHFTINTFNSGVGHYTQMVWAKSDKLGCGYATRCGWEYLVCRYKPSGNFLNEPIFQTGAPCSACSGSCRNGLCDS